MRYAFWLSFTLIAYTYFGYPLLLAILGRLQRGGRTPEGLHPGPRRVSVIIAAYNEERHIRDKLQNVLGLDYAVDLLEVLVGSDGSTDRTNEIVLGCREPRVRLVAFRENRGKTAVQEACVAEAQGEILVFMDAASLCNRGALREIVKHFSDERIGCVAGRVVYVATRGNLVEASQRLYWSYGTLLRHLEGGLGCLVGVDGPLYAIRRSAYVPVQPDIMSDFLSPLLIRSRGWKVVYEPAAIATEDMTQTDREEFRTRRRIVVRGLHSLSRYPHLLNICKHPLLAFQILSHKVLRWLTVVLLAGLMVSSVFGRGGMVRGVVLIAGVLCAVGFFVGLLLDSRGKTLRALAVPYYFVLGNIAAAAGIWDFLRGRIVVSWVPVRN